MKNLYMAVLPEDIDKTVNFHKMVGSNQEFPLLGRKINEVEATPLPGVLVVCEESSGYDLVFIYIITV